MTNKYNCTIECDGASAGNPGVMGIGVAIYSNDKLIHMFYQTCAEGTNNEAEYLAIIQALIRFKELNIQCKNILVCSDSEVVICQLNGEYKVNHDHLYRLYNSVQALKKELNCKISFRWTPREENKIADALASKGAGMPQAIVRDNEVIEWEDKRIKENIDRLEELPDLSQDVKNIINSLNNKSNKTKFKDFIKLKSGGIDKYSRLKLDTLKEYIQIRFGEYAYEWISEALEGANEDYVKNALKWTARGLKPNLALKKASVDMEISNRNRGSSD